MTEHHPTRREMMRPLQLLGLAFGAALFAGIVTVITTGVFQDRPADQRLDGLELAAVIAGVTFIVTLVTIALLMLAVDPSKVTQSVDRPVLYPDEAEGDAPASEGPGVPGDDSSTGQDGRPKA